MKKQFLFLLILVISLQQVSGAETDLYAVFDDPSIYFDYRWSDNNTIFTMIVDFEIINPTQNDMNITFGDTCGFKPKVDADFYSDIVEFDSYIGESCGFAFRTFTYSAGNTSESKLLDLKFYGRNITELLEGRYTFYLDHPDISISYNTTMMVGLYDTVFINHDEDISIDTSRIQIRSTPGLMGLILIYKIRKTTIRKTVTGNQL